MLMTHHDKYCEVYKLGTEQSDEETVNLQWAFRKDLFKKITLEVRTKIMRMRSHIKRSWRSIPDRGNNNFKDLEDAKNSMARA